MSTKTDELMRLHDEAARAYAWQAAGHDMGDAVSLKTDALRSAIQEALRDAERFRWLLATCATVDYTKRPGEKLAHVEIRGTRWTRRASLDAAIDAAMQPPEAS